MIIEADDHAGRNAIFGQAVEPSPAIHAGIEGPAERVRHKSRLDAPRRNFPKLLDPDAVDLRIQAIELQPVHQFLCERTARSFGEHRYLSAEIVAGGVVVLRPALFIDAFVLGDHAGDSAALVNQISPRELRE